MRWFGYPRIKSIVEHGETYMPPAIQQGSGSVPAISLGKKLGPWLLVAPVVLFLCVFMVWPVLFNFHQSLLVGTTGEIGIGNYVNVLSDSYYLLVAGQTFLLASGVTLACLVLGYPVAYAMARSGGTVKAFLVLVLVAPLLVNVVVRSYGWMILFGGGGVVETIAHALGLKAPQLMYTWLGIGIALVHVLLPFMVISIASTLESVDSRLEDAAGVLGASPMRRLWYVTLPLSVEGIVTGSIITFALTIGSFVTVMLLGDTSTMVLPLLIYQQLTSASDWQSAATLGMLLLVAVMSLLWFQGRFRRMLKERKS